MKSRTPFGHASPTIRPLQLRDVEAIATLAQRVWDDSKLREWQSLNRKLNQFQHWFGLLNVLRLFPNLTQHQFCIYVAEQEGQLCGLIHVMPCNRTRTTWRVEQVMFDAAAAAINSGLNLKNTGSHLLRHCFEVLWEARTWVLEVNIQDKQTLALYRQNGFQPLAQVTNWNISPDVLQRIAQHEPSLPNLLPVSNADAQLLYQLDTVSMPPLLRQVFDRHVEDFKTPFWSAIANNIHNWINQTEVVSGYVFEPQRKAAIGHFSLTLHRDGDRPHEALLTVHPAYTWLYPELMAQIAKVAQTVPGTPLHITSTDYQTEREDYFEHLGAERIEHTLLMSRSVWHKLRETKPLEGLQLPDMLGLQPARTPIPTRMSWAKFLPKRDHRTDSSRPNPPETQA